MQPVRQSAFFDALAVALAPRQPSAAHELRAADAGAGGGAETGADAEAGDDAEAGAEAAPVQHSLVLLVEDNIMNQKVAIRQLNLLGYAADVANNGQEALDALATIPYALVLMDCQMPLMDGFEATRRIRNTELSSGAHVQIVAMTANAMRGDRELCLEAGMDDYLSKPILRGQLEALLARRLPQGRTSLAPAPALMLNLNRLCDMFGADKAFQQEMLELFITTTRPVFEQLDQAICSHDFAAIKALAHRLDGSCANLGIEELAELARAAVRATHATDLQRLQQLHAAMRLAFARLDDFVNRMKEANA